MSDLSRLLDDVYGNGGAPQAPPPAGTASPAAAPIQPPAPAPRSDEPDWASDSALDEAFAEWVPGPAADASAAERSVFGSADSEPLDEDDWVLAAERDEAAPAADQPEGLVPATPGSVRDLLAKLLEDATTPSPGEQPEATDDVFAALEQQPEPERRPEPEPLTDAADDPTSWDLEAAPAQEPEPAPAPQAAVDAVERDGRPGDGAIAAEEWATDSWSSPDTWPSADTWAQAAPDAEAPAAAATPAPPEDQAADQAVDQAVAAAPDETASALAPLTVLSEFRHRAPGGAGDAEQRVPAAGAWRREDDDILPERPATRRLRLRRR